MTSPKIFLLLGSNIGDRVNNLMQAEHALEQLGTVEKKSSIYQTDPWGKINQPNFLNQALLMKSLLTPSALLKEVLEIEHALGRTRKEKWGERLIDIDIIYFGNTVMDSDDLVIPHPHVQDRRFVLAPLVELDAAFVHPKFNKTNEQLLAECTDQLAVNKF